MADLFNADFLEYIDLLNENEVEYVLVGGMAVNIHGYRRSTGDMDLFVNPTQENHDTLKKVHLSFEMMMGEMEFLENFLNTSKYDVYTFGTSPVQIDLMTTCKRITFKDAFDSTIHHKVKNTLVRTVNYDTLRMAKNSTNRTRNKADIEA